MFASATGTNPISTRMLVSDFPHVTHAVEGETEGEEESEVICVC